MDPFERLARAFGAFGVELCVADDDAPADEKWCLLRGQTFPHRQAFKRGGGVWDRQRHAWLVRGVGALDAILELIENPGAAGDPFDPSRSGAARGLAENARPAWGAKHYHGHRQRLRDKLLEVGADALADYELVELLLFFSIRYRDTKPTAKAMLERFGGLSGLLAAPLERIAEIDGLDPGRQRGVETRAQAEKDLHFTQALLSVVKALSDRSLRERLSGAPDDAPVYDDAAARAYLAHALGGKRNEESRALFLDKRRRLLRDEVLGRGTVDNAPLYPRELARRALELGAVAVIVAHNHPTGDPRPSAEDIAVTRRAADALHAIGARLLDHVVVGSNACFSLREAGLIPR